MVPGIFVMSEGQRTHQPPARFGRNGVSPRHDQAAQLAMCLRSTALGEQILRLKGPLRQRGQGAAQTGHRRLNIHGAAQAELGGGAHEARLIGEKRPRRDVDVAPLSLDGLRQDLAILKSHNGRIDRDIAPGGSRTALNRRVDLAIHKPDRIGGLHRDITPAGLAGLRRHGTILAKELRTGVDRHVSSIGRPRVTRGNGRTDAEGD